MGSRKHHSQLTCQVLRLFALGDDDALLMQTISKVFVTGQLAGVAAVVTLLLLIAAQFHILRRQVLVFDLNGTKT